MNTVRNVGATEENMSFRCLGKHWLNVGIILGIKNRHFLPGKMQWAAVMMYSSEMNDPPHIAVLPWNWPGATTVVSTLTCHL